MAARLIVDRGVQRVIGFGHDGYDKHPGHIEAHDILAEAVSEARRMGRVVTAWHLNSRHVGDHEVPIDDGARQRRLGAMAWHRSQYDIRHLSQGRYRQGLVVGGHAVRSDTWMMLAEGGVLPLIERGETYDEA